MRVYYLTGAQFAISNIALKRLKISRYRDLNDPFELLGVNLSDKASRRAFRKMKQRLDENQGLICFSRNWGNPLLWGHYAEKHTGVALGFDVPDGLLLPVMYAENLADFNLTPESGKPTKEAMNSLIRTKFKDWKYEDELRLFTRLDHKSDQAGLYFHSFSKNLKLREVILGPNCSLPLPGVCKLVKSLDLSVKVIQSRIAFTRFEILENKAATRADGDA